MQNVEDALLQDEWDPHEFDGECHTNEYGFTFNENGVCINPISEVLYSKAGTGYQIRIEMSFNNGFWSYGYFFVLPSCGHCAGTWHGEYLSREECRQAAIKYALQYVENVGNQTIISKIKNMIYGEQLDLFSRKAS